MGIRIDQETCTGCGRCVDVCDLNVLEQQDGVIGVIRPQECFVCGHCMAACPTKSIQTEAFDYEAARPVPAETIPPEALHDFLASCRSMRHFKDEPVPAELLEQAVEMGGCAPMGLPPSSVEVLVLNGREKVESIVPDIIAGYERFASGLRNPIFRFFISRSVGPQFDEMADHLLPWMVEGAQLYREEGLDTYTWGAPAMMLFHADKSRLCYSENCWIALVYTRLCAESLGLGSCIIGVIAPIVEQDAALKARLGIPKGNETVACLILGYAAEGFERTIPRRFRSVEWME